MYCYLDASIVDKEQKIFSYSSQGWRIQDGGAAFGKSFLRPSAMEVVSE